MTITTTEASPLQPDARMTRVLAGEIGFAPAAFVGRAGIATVDGRTVLVLGADEAKVVFSTDGESSAHARERIAEALSIPIEAVLVGASLTSGDPAKAALAALGSLAPARVEWTDGLMPQGGSAAWSAMSRFWVARIVSLDGGALFGTLVVAPAGHSAEAASEIIEGATGAPAVIVSAVAGEKQFAEARGRALGHAVVASLEVLPAAARELYLDRVVESGAPLAVWRPRPVIDQDVDGIQVNPATWQIGPVGIQLDSNHDVLDIVLPAGPYAG